jgi:hypothetical protein
LADDLACHITSKMRNEVGGSRDGKNWKEAIS